jgi:hypothetical protein
MAWTLVPLASPPSTALLVMEACREFCNRGENIGF